MFAVFSTVQVKFRVFILFLTPQGAVAFLFRENSEISLQRSQSLVN
jgi:hypothetical protein